MKKGAFHLIMFVICGLGAVGWIANCVKDFAYRTPGTVDAWNFVLAVIWSAAFAVHLYGYVSQRKKGK